MLHPTAPVVVPQPRSSRDRPDQSRVLLVSADHVLRMSWASNLRRLGIAVSVEETASLATARARIRTGPQLDLVIVDAELTLGGVALDLSGEDRVVVSGTPDGIDAVQDALRSGARGYLFGPTPPDGGPSGAADVDSAVVATPSNGGAPSVSDVTGMPRQLSSREVEVVQHAARGESNIEIGQALGLSPLTVKSHLSRIGRRLGSGDRAHTVLLALRAGAIT